MSRRSLVAVAVVGATVMASLPVALARPGAVEAADGDCGLAGATATFDGDGGALGAWNDPTMWDTGSVPIQGQVCIPAGKTATLGAGVTLIPTFGSQLLRVEGTLRVEGAGAASAVYGSTTVENAGTVEVAASASFMVGPYATTFKNLAGGEVIVAAGASFSVAQTFQNLGGVVDLTTGGTFAVSSGTAVFEQGASSDVVPVPGTVVGGVVTMSAGKLLGTGTGAGSFEVSAGAQVTLAGTLAEDQSITAACSGFSDTYLQIAASTTVLNDGTITFGPRLGGTTCVTHLNVAAGAEFTNHGQVTFGSPGNPSHTYYLDGHPTGHSVNADDGTITVNGTLAAIGPLFSTDGAFVVNPGATFNAGNNSAFELRDGTLTNHGTIGLHPANTFAVAGVMRVMLGDHVGNPIGVHGFRLELLGPGAATFEVKPSGIAYLQDPSAIVVHPLQSILVNNGTLATVGPVENQGLIELTGAGDGFGSVGTAGSGAITNHGVIRLTKTGEAVGGAGTVNVPIVNESDGLLEALSGRGCNLYDVVNSGLFDLRTTCSMLFASLTLNPSSVLRVHSSAAALSGIVNLQGTSSIGGTLDVVTDAGSPPPAGAPRDLLVGRGAPYNQPVNGSFASVTGATFSPSLGYSVVYTVPHPRRVQLQTVSSVTDLVVSSLAAPANASVGDDVTVTWNTSVGSVTSTSFTDSVFLSLSPTIDASSVLVGRVTRSGTVGAGVQRAGSIQIRVPATAPGQRFLVVVADSGNALAVANRGAASVAVSIQVTATALTVGSPPVNVTVGADGTRVVGATTAPLEGTRLVRLSGSASQDVIVTYSPTTVTAWAASGRLPSDGDHDVAGSGGSMLIPKGDGVSERYVLLRNTSASPVVVSIGATAPGLSITSSTPTSALAGAPAPTAVLVNGTGFGPTSAARLVCGAVTVDPVDTHVQGPTQLTSLFTLPTALGSCSVEVGAAVSPNGFTVSAGPVAVDPATLSVDIDVSAPSVVRSLVDNRVTVRWTNRTGYSLPAPLFEVSVDAGTLRLPDHAGGGVKSLWLLGIAPSGPAGVLAPGASGSVDLILRDVAAHQTVQYFTADVVRAEPFDFGQALAAGLGDEVPEAARDWVETNGPAMVGMPAVTTLAGFEAHLGEVATALSDLGRRVADTSRLIGYDLARVTDAARLDAFTSGEFGVGQAGMPIARLSVDSLDDDVIISDGSQRFRFNRTATGQYVAPPGVTDVLVQNVSGWALTARDGRRSNFSTTGLLTSAVDTDLQTTLYTYSGDRLTSVTSQNGDVTSFGYDLAGRITSMTDAVGRQVTFGYDGAGRMASQTASGMTTTMTWDTDHLLESVTGPDGVVTATLRDAFGRPTSVLVNGATDVTFTYHDDGSVTATDALGHSTTTWIDDTGVEARRVDALSRLTTLRRDDDGSPIGMTVDGAPVGPMLLSDTRGTLVGAVDGAGGTTRVGFDLDGFMQSVTDQDGRMTRIGRDASTRPTSITDPIGKTSTMSYDAHGRVAGVTDRSGRAVTFSYDAKDLATQVTTAGGSVTMTYDAHRNPLSAAGPSGTTTFTYDGADRVQSVTYPNGLGITYGYDAQGRRVSTETTDGQVVGVTFDARGRVASMTASGTTVVRYEYDAASRLSAAAFANGTRTEMTFDALGRVTRRRTTCCTADGLSAGGTTVSDVVLTYDALDRVATRVDEAGTTTYSYDGASRLIGAVTVGASPRSITYTYDRNGNRLTLTDSVLGSRSATISAAGRPTQYAGNVITHDAEGRQLTNGSSTYTWDERGLLATTVVGGVTTSYEYDALGTLISRTTAGVTTKVLVDPTGLGSLLGEYSDTGDRQAGYVWGQGLAARLDAAGVADVFYASDPRGDVVALTDASGAVTDRARYLPFGEVAERTGSTVQPFWFQGGWGLRTDPSGLVNARARTYAPALGRFLSEDPRLFSADNPATWVSSDPINRIDVDGGQEGFFGELAADPLGWGIAAFGFDPWSPPSISDGVGNSSQFTGLASATLGVAADHHLANTLNALSAAGDKALAQAFEHGERAAKLLADGQTNNAWKALNSAVTGRAGAINDYRKTLADKASAVKNNQYLKKVLGRVGLGADIVAGVNNVVKGWTGDPVLDGFSIVRQAATVRLKFLLGTINPFLPLVVDPIANGVDIASLQWMQGWYEVDPTNLWEDPLHRWNARTELKKKKGESGGADSSDPNAIVGPSGASVGGQRYVARDDVLPYTVLFENLPTASLAAAQVTITHTLDTDLDATTFTLGPVGFGGQQWPAPEGVRAWSTILDDRATSGLFVRLKARLDLGTRTVTWTFTAVDPLTGDQPADPTVGFLPPNAASPEGEGFVSFSVRAAGAAPTGTAVTAQASIVFDANPAIATNVDTVVVDGAAPAAAPSVGASSTNPVVVTLGAADDAGGAGVGGVDVWASRDGGVFTKVGDAVTGATLAFTGVVGSSYRFVALPTDLVGNTGTLSAATGVVQVVDPGGPPPPPPTQHGITVSDPVLVAEPATTSARVFAVFTVSLSKPYATKVTVKAATVDGTARSRKDYTKRSVSTITFKPGETSKVITVRITGDDVVEPEESFRLVLSRAVGAPIVDASATATIAADPPLPVVSVGDATPVSEPTGSAKVDAVFTVSLSKAWGKPVSVKVQTTPGSASTKDFSRLSTTVKFKPGETTKLVRVRVSKDTLAEPAEQFTVLLTKPTRAVIGDGTGVGTINAS